ncbi:MAG: sprT domain-containing protein, partial [Prevotella sp.]|nr:sprT domain-containing protein [Prevotella sp.]
MVPTIPYIERKFEEFNQQMFAGELPKIPIVLSDAKSFLGKCVYKKRMGKDGKIEYYDFKLRINT